MMMMMMTVVLVVVIVVHHHHHRGPHGSEREDRFLLGCNSVQSDRNYLRFGETYSLHFQCNIKTALYCNL